MKIPLTLVCLTGRQVWHLGDRIRAEPDKVRRAELKRGLPCVTISGEFAGGHKAEQLVRHSGLLCVDFDAADNPDMAGRAGEWRDQLVRDEAAMLAFVSASGNGVAVVCRIEPERHAEAFDALREHFRIRYGLTADRSCRDVSRLRFLSHDPGVAENPSPRVFRNYTLAAPPQPERERPGLLCAAAPALAKERCEEILSALERVSPDDRYGLKKHFLKKHMFCVDRFYRNLGKAKFVSEAAQKCKARFEKNREKLFMFLEHDGVPWNNNNAELAIKAFARLRQVIEGLSTVKGIKEYLILLSVCQTCKYQGLDFLDFLRSGEKDIAVFAASKRGRRQKTISYG